MTKDFDRISGITKAASKKGGVKRPNKGNPLGVDRSKFNKDGTPKVKDAEETVPGSDVPKV